MKSELTREEYLRYVWTRDPVVHSKEILTARDRLNEVRLHSADPKSRRDDREANQDVIAESSPGGNIKNPADIGRIRQEFFALSQQVVASQLIEFDVGQEPSIMAVVEKLTAINSNRGMLEQLARNDQIDERLRLAIRESILEPPQKAMLIQESYEKTLNSPLRRRLAANSAEIVRDRYPAIFEIQKDWLESIRQCASENRTHQIDWARACQLILAVASVVYMLYQISSKKY